MFLLPGRWSNTYCHAHAALQLAVVAKSFARNLTFVPMQWSKVRAQVLGGAPISVQALDEVQHFSNAVTLLAPKASLPEPTVVVPNP